MKLPFDTVCDCHLFLRAKVGDHVTPTEQLLTSAIEEFATTRGIDPTVMSDNYVSFSLFIEAMQSLIDDGWIEPVDPSEVN